MPRCCRCSFVCSQFDSADLKRPSNETLLCVAFVSFLGFTTIQSVVALIAQSEAMLGDCAAMAVDAFTYGFNLYAERKKNEDDEFQGGAEEAEIELSAASTGEENATTHDDEREKLERHLQSRRRHLHLELVPPLVSVTFLLIVVGFVLHESIQTLILDAHRSEKEQSRPNLVLMMTFSILNLLLDVVNVTCFARAKHLMGYKTEETKEGEDTQQYGVIDADEELAEENGAQYEIHQPTSNDEDGSIEEQSGDFSEEPAQSQESNDDERVNLNMCSAYTHVFADTCRSIAVIIAAGIAEIVPSVTSEVADATAAVIVSIIIFASVLPLFRGLCHTWSELRSISREEKALIHNEPEALDGEIT